MITPEQAERIARRAHGDQQYAGGPYVDNHLLPVAERVRQLGGDDELVAAAILHDIVEDTDITFLKLFSLGATMRQVTAIDRVTEREGESFKARVSRAAELPDSALIKKADAGLNRDTSRAEGNESRAEYYQQAVDICHRNLKRWPDGVI